MDESPIQRPSTPPRPPLADVTNVGSGPPAVFDTPRRRKTPTHDLRRPSTGRPPPWPRFGKRIPLQSISMVTKKIFGYEPMEWQLDIFQKMAEGYDTMAIAGTGYGKSLVFGLGAIAAEMSKRKGTMLVISPLKSLEEDQVKRFHMADPVELADGSKVKITAVLVNEDNREKSVFTQLESGVYRLCYASPECLLRNQDFKQLFRKEDFRKRLVAIAVDEAHLIETWKDTFRKDYSELEVLKVVAGIDVPWVSLTATCSTRTFEVIYTSLGMGGVRPFWGIDMGSNRPNLELWVRRMEYSQASFADLLAFVPKAPKAPEDLEKTLFYFKSRSQAQHALDLCRKLIPEEYAELLQQFTATASKEYKKRTQDDLATGEVRWVFATIALGMGLDIPDIKTVVVYGVTSLSDAFQEGGRAGRNPLLRARWIWIVEPWAFEDAANGGGDDGEAESVQRTKKQLEQEERRNKMDAAARAYVNISQSDSNELCMRAFLCDHFRPRPDLPGFEWYTGDPDEAVDVDVEWVVKPQELTPGPSCGCSAKRCRPDPNVQTAILSVSDHELIQYHRTRLLGPSATTPAVMRPFSSHPQLRCSEAERKILHESLQQWREIEWSKIADSHPFLSPQWIIPDTSLKRLVDNAHIFLNADIIDESLLAGSVKWITNEAKTKSLVKLLEDFRDARRQRDQRHAQEHAPKRRQAVPSTPCSTTSNTSAFTGQFRLVTPMQQPSFPNSPALRTMGEGQTQWRIQGYKKG